MIDVKLTDNYPDLKRALEGISNHLDRLTPLTKKIAGAMEDAVANSFEKHSGSGAPTEKGLPAWPDLSDVTKSHREKKGYWPGQILVQTGRLKDSIESGYSDNSAFVYVAGKEFPYAAIHQFGGKAGRGRGVTIPARPFLTISDADLQEIQDDIILYLRNL